MEKAGMGGYTVDGQNSLPGQSKMRNHTEIIAEPALEMKRLVLGGFQEDGKFCQTLKNVEW